MTKTFSPNERVEQDLSETKTRNGFFFFAANRCILKSLEILGMYVELCLRKTYKEESARLEEETNNQFPPGAVHVIVKEDAMLPLIGC